MTTTADKPPPAALDKNEVKAAIAANPRGFYGRAVPGAKLKSDDDRWKMLCPFHPDGDPSLTIYPDGKWHCFGCEDHGDGIDFLGRLHGLEFADALREAAGILGMAATPARQKPEPVRYQVRDADGTLLATHCRLDLPDGQKKIWWEPKGVKPPTLPLYGLPALLAASPGEPVFLCEGEKATDALTRAGKCAVGTYGTGAMPCDESLQPLLGRIVILWSDADGPGRAHMHEIGTRLQALGGEPYLLTWADAPEKGDAADFLATNDAAALDALMTSGGVSPFASVETAAPAEDVADKQLAVMPLTFAELESLVAETSWAWPGYLPNGALSILIAPPEAGKSYVGLDIMRCFATGADWPDGSPNENPPGHCLLIDYEGTIGEYIERAKGYGIPKDMLMGLHPDVMPFLTEPASFDAMRQWLAHAEVRFMFIDSWRDGAPGVTEESSTEVAPTLQPLKLLARDFGIPILVAHHTLKKGASYTLTMADARGSGAFAAAGRVMLGIDKPNPGSEARLLRVLKRNAGVKPDPLGFEMGPPNEDGTPSGIVWTDPVYRHRATPKMDQAREAIHNALRRQPLAHKDLRGILETAGVKRRTGDEALAAMREQGQVVAGADGRLGLVSPLEKVS